MPVSVARSHAYSVSLPPTLADLLSFSILYEAAYLGLWRFLSFPLRSCPSFSFPLLTALHTIRRCSEVCCVCCPRSPSVHAPSLAIRWCTPLRACLGRGPTTREILFYPLPRSNSLGFTGGGDTRHTRGTRSRSVCTHVASQTRARIKEIQRDATSSFALAHSFLSV